ncbi:MAG: Unknown protein [uncultured Sulfurovum sp.]|uniref:Periplasmic protein n=1 Tax=uncultured Sulfurovum sp. TaxID=269237 RepID=A0A6S6SIL4_9BACT|nr:MAG: Unknown protein [uncultured Sulfurovum sp.]
MKKAILLLSIFTLSGQINADDFLTPKVEIPEIKTPQRPLDLPTIRMPIKVKMPQKVEHFKGTLSAKVIRKKLKNINSHKTRVFKKNHKYSFSLNVTLPQLTKETSNQKKKRFQIPKISLVCSSRNVAISGQNHKDNPNYITPISKTFALNQKSYSGNFMLFKIEDIKDLALDYTQEKTPVSQALKCEVSIKENKREASAYDYVKYELTFFDHGKK